MNKRTFTASARRALLRRGRTILRGARGRNDVLGGLPDAQRAELAEIHNALDRIERGIYGKCVACGQDMPEQLLTTKPERGKCTDCTAPREDAEPAPSQH